MNCPTPMNALPSTTCLSSELCDAFSQYLEGIHPHSGLFSWSEAAQLLSTFTGISAHHIKSALGGTTTRGMATVSKDELHLSLEKLMRTDGATDAWWDSPGVTIAALTGAAGQEARGGADSRKDIGLESLASVRARSHGPPPPCSTPGEGSYDSEMDAGSGQPSLRPTLNSWGKRGNRRSSAFSVPSVSSQWSENAAASMERVVAAALGELDMFIEDEQCSIQFHPDCSTFRFPSEVSNDSERFGVPADGRRRIGDRCHRPSPALQPGDDEARPPDPSVAPTSTLAELDRFVQRGKTSKVCKQFVQTGRCTFGVRCLYHHPSRATVSSSKLHVVRGCMPENAPKSVGCYTVADACFASLRRPLAATLPGSFFGDASPRSVRVCAFPVQPTPTCLSAAQSTPQQLQVWGHVLSTHLTTTAAERFSEGALLAGVQ
ncbi:hypothetical protein CUR178_03186 [Leishmania enriettii]|uniref:C3H1-type domain-containing protein n=1 Tax=Leishmania enriettii TaxID=5663 RepID=A0A836GE15_LEIEN|nr:hypothetical protein CUR178_03186 [Leishmania enriettii]